jgi:hypothetical protein
MPKTLRNATLEEIRNHEERTNANVRIGGYEMEEHCPTGEIQYFHVELTSSDLARVFLLGEQTFAPHTKGRSFKLVDITSTAESMAMARRPAGEVNRVDLHVDSGLEPVLVSNNLECGPLVTIDGNHRLTAHYARSGTIDGVKVFVAVHSNMLAWDFVPPLARLTNKPMHRSGGSVAS